MIFDDVTSDDFEDSNMPDQKLDAVDEYQRKPNDDAYEQYRNGGYQYLQNLFANALLRNQSSSSAYISMIYTPSKSSKYNKDSFSDTIDGETWSFVISLVFIVPLYRLIANTVSDKETKIREAMRIMGLDDFPYWFTWFSYYVIINTIQCIIILLLVLPVFEYSNKFLVFIYFWLFGMSQFGFGVFISAFFSDSKSAAITGTMIFFLSSFIYEPIATNAISETTKNLFSFFPVTAASLAGNNLVDFEASGVGLNFDNANEVYENYRFATCLWMNIISSFVFGILGLYLENVLPAASGVRKPFWFPFTCEYWCGTSKGKQNNQDEESEAPSGNKIANSDDVDNQEDTEHNDVNPDYFEDIPENLRRKEDDNQFISISNMKKKFGSNLYAINGLSGEMYEDQIFALLGHNGAGKTTTINVLCGMTSSSTGKASIYGYDVKTQMKEIRKITGLCPQHNILFPKLTVREHLSIFSDFKGMNSKDAKVEIDQLLKDLNLESRASMLSKNLSGGYKRKLSLGIAL